ncbi:cupin domain-containing protein [Anaeromyxobacter sp. PSR-1]|uniref:cupin domain-containing protein n=1 Tax=unclassified Anaeromyxobacter TaxID=2620896 RepID=UPI0005DD488E|nr:cupin domain-containing protein [Anaeromyxobacter sp. PSR-1]GAO03700.1 cupin domain protein [Anaeromyxobacter sp. PSR-1]
MSPTRRHPHVVNVAEIPQTVTEQGTRFAFRRRQLSAGSGGEQLGCSHMELPPGKTAWAHHFHCANEEAIFVLAGSGLLRLGDAEVRVGPGDYVALPAGPAAAHQLRNDGAAPLQYLALSTMLPTDITVYPDSGKVGLFAGAAPGGPKERRYLAGFTARPEGGAWFDGERVDG